MSRLFLILCPNPSLVNIKGVNSQRKQVDLSIALPCHLPTTAPPMTAPPMTALPATITFQPCLHLINLSANGSPPQQRQCHSSWQLPLRRQCARHPVTFQLMISFPRQLLPRQQYSRHVPVIFQLMIVSPRQRQLYSPRQATPLRVMTDAAQQGQGKWARILLLVVFYYLITTGLNTI